MNQQEAKELLRRYQAGRCTPEEISIFESWYLKYGEDQPDLPVEQYDQMGKEVYANLPGVNHYPKFRSGFRTLGIAAGFLFSMGTCIYTMFKIVKKNDPIVAEAIVPGGHRAILTLSSGKKVILKADQSGISVKNQTLVYNDGRNVLSMKADLKADAGQQMMTTPNGGDYQLTLSDGTMVWLNAATTIRFPGTFDGMAPREIELTGEAYFEVTKDARHPFIVKGPFGQIEVLGTHFNINSYSDERVNKITLLEGRIRLRAGNQTATLIRGQQAVYTKNPQNININNQDTAETVAWKKGFFVFEHENIRSIMRKLSRWYDIEPVFSDRLPETGFGGTISRNKPISEVLAVLELTQAVHFQIEGRRIKVMP